MSHLLREHAPITSAGWEEIDSEARERLTPNLAARKLVDFGGPLGWEHSAKNELILGKRVNRFDKAARAQLRALLDRFQIEPALVRGLTAKGLDPRSEPS